MKVNTSLARFGSCVHHTAVRSAALATIVLGLFGQVPQAAAQLVTYDIAAANANTDASLASAAAADVTASDLTFTGVTAFGSDGTFAATGWGTAGSPDLGKYFTFTVAPTLGNQITFTSLTGSLFRGHVSALDHGPEFWELRSSADSFGSSIGAALDISPAASGQQIQFSISLTGLGTTTGSTTFRLYGYDDTGTSRSGGLANTLALPGTGSDFVVNGTVSPVPEPEVTAGVVALGLLAFAIARSSIRRRAITLV